MTANWSIRLQQRKIYLPAVQAGWVPDRDGWRYPVFDLWSGERLRVPDRLKSTGADRHGGYIWRWKAFNSEQKPKYEWIPNDLGEHRPSYYALPGAAKAIQSTGTVYIASGEPDVLAYAAGGIHNVLSVGFGEGQISKTLLEDFARLGVKLVKLYPDMDKQGNAWANALHYILTHADIEVEIYDLAPQGAEGTEGMDINRFLIGLPQASDLRQALEKCQRRPDPDHTRHDEDAHKARTASFDIPDAYFEAIERALGVPGYKASGWSKPMRCPFGNHAHDDKLPSAGWHKEWHVLKCFKCTDHAGRARVWTSKAVAEYLGIKLSDYLPQRPAASKNGRAKLDAGDLITWDQASDQVLRIVAGNVPPESRLPLRMPFPGIASLGGFAHRQPVGKMTVVFGDTGAGKTQFVESWMDGQRRDGRNGYVWGPEWGPDDYVWRGVQRYGGPTLDDYFDHLSWHAAAAAGIPEEKRDGKPFTEDMRRKSEFLIGHLRQWPGKVSFVPRLGVTVDSVLEKMLEGIKAQQAQGRTIDFIVIDYAQLFTPVSANDAKTAEVERTLATIKAFAVDHRVHAIVCSQITKDASRDHTAGRRADKADMQYVRGDYFNLGVGVMQVLDDDGEPETFSLNGETYVRGRAYVVKNSTGRRGHVDMRIGLTTRLWA